MSWSEFEESSEKNQKRGSGSRLSGFNWKKSMDRPISVGMNETTFHLRTDQLIRTSASIMLAIVVISSALMSWNGLVQLGQMAGMTWYSVLLPLSIDGMLLLGSLETLHSVLGKRKSSFGTLLTSVGVTLSIGGNMLSSAHLGWLASSVHAIPPLMLFLSLEAFTRIMKHRISVEAVEQKKALRAESRQKPGLAVVPNISRPVQRDEADGKAPQNTREVDANQPSIDELQAVLSTIDPDSSKAGKVEAMLTLFPHAKTGLLADSLGETTKTVGTTIARVRKRVEVTA